LLFPGICAFDGFAMLHLMVCEGETTTDQLVAHGHTLDDVPMDPHPSIELVEVHVVDSFERVRVLREGHKAKPAVAVAVGVFDLALPAASTAPPSTTTAPASASASTSIAPVACVRAVQASQPGSLKKRPTGKPPLTLPLVLWYLHVEDIAKGEESGVQRLRVHLAS
jgi:hypothetical protein